MTKQHERLRDYMESEYYDFDPANKSQRLTSLYSDFTYLSQLNEFGYNANVDYWRHIFTNCSIHGYFTYHGYTVVLDKNSLAQDFLSKNEGKPLALGCVLDAMEKDGSIISLKNYDRIYSTTSSTWSSWLWQKMTPTLFSSFSSTQSDISSLYVVMNTIKELAEHIYQSYTKLPVKTNSNSILTFSDFRKQYGTYNQRTLTDNDLTLLLKYLASQSKVAVEDGVQGYGPGSFMVIKFIEPNMACKITEQDKATISIRTTCTALQYQTHEMQQQMERLAISAQEHHLKKQKPQTLYALRRKRHISDVLDKRLRSLGEMENLLLKMESAQDDLQIVQAFDNGAKALQSIFSNGLSVQSVEETMARIQETYDDQKDVEQAIMDGSDFLVENDNGKYDDDLLLKELEELEQQQKELTSTEKINPYNEKGRPSVPSETLTSPSSSSPATDSDKCVLVDPSSYTQLLLDEAVASHHQTENLSPNLSKESYHDKLPRIAQLE